MLVFLGVDWVVVDGNCNNMRLDDDWVWDLDWDMDWEWNSNFLDDWNFDLLVDWIFLNVVMVHGMNVVWNFDFDVLTKRKKKISIKC